ncbi:pyrroloquinoline quinone biosynthesis protein E [Arboricoccus pini]|uniref:PqqA peptide cyclase n=1 Tax=Arboricoccus pini TaxID=1963835 RepID=A0A212RWN9_9PROT|nr:pyrroloquinoline quinone biosynthesis protein PqqE [Arboricoccus pini]SNB77026.1 pyrroloquinoline quinone biosynthesis protein E [Arboricoccus pini]
MLDIEPAAPPSTLKEPWGEPPMGMLAELTHRCPLQCPYCSNPVELERVAGELDAAAWKRVFAEAVELGVLQLHLSGGEPTVRKDLEDLVGEASRLGLYTNLITSGVLLSEARLLDLKRAGLDHIQLSLQGATALTGDRIGHYKGGHAKKLELAKAIGRAGLPLTINAVVHRQNLDELEGLIDLALACDAHRIEVAHVQYYGWALANRAALMPTRAQLERATAIVDDARVRHAGRLMVDYVIPDYYAKRPKPCMGGWARTVLNVTPSGAVLPCHAAQSIKSLTFPNVQDHDLAWIWQSSEPFQRFRGTDWMPEPCRSCSFKEQDFGGCRCQAMALTGDAANTDPACEFSPFHDLLRLTAEDEAASEPPAFTYRRPLANAPAMGTPGLVGATKGMS